MHVPSKNTFPNLLIHKNSKLIIQFKNIKFKNIISEVVYVIITKIPKSPEEFLQIAGRTGRDKLGTVSPVSQPFFIEHFVNNSIQVLLV